MSQIAVFGMGYVGCVTAACLSRDGHQVIGVDVDNQKLREIKEGRSPLSEPGLDDLIRQETTAGRLNVTSEVSKAVLSTQMALITVGTPSSDDGSVQTRNVESVLREIGASLTEGHEYIIVIRSTILPGILENELSPLLEKTTKRKLGNSLWICNSPEFLREGTAIKDYDHPPFAVVGAENQLIGNKVMDIYRRVTGERIITDTRTAALVKYACNAFHALKVSFSNEIGTLAHAAGANGHEVMRVFCKDKKLNLSDAYLRPGFAFGGSCLPKDLRAIARYSEQHALHLTLLNSILPSNEAQLQRAIKAICNTPHRQIGIVGLSFKATTDDLRESPLVQLVESLLGKGYQIKIYDPNINLSRLRGRNLAYVDKHLPHLAALLIKDPGEIFAHASLLVLGTDISDSINWQTDYSGEILDLRKDLATQELHRVCAKRLSA